MKKIILSLLVIGFAFAAQGFEVVEKSGSMMDKLSTYHVKFKYTPLSPETKTLITLPIRTEFHPAVQPGYENDSVDNTVDLCSLTTDALLGTITIQIFLPTDLTKPVGETINAPLYGEVSHVYNTNKDDCVAMLPRIISSMPSSSNSVDVKFKNKNGVDNEVGFILQGNTPATVIVSTDNYSKLVAPFNFRSVHYYWSEQATKVFGVKTAKELLIEKLRNDSLQHINDSLRLANPDYEFIKD